MAIRTLTQIIDDAVTFIQSKIPALSLLVGTVARDVVIESPAQEFEKTYTELDRIQRQQTLQDATAFTDEELTNLAASYGLSRLEGAAASGNVIFRLTTFDASTGNIIIPAGTEVSTAVSTTTQTTISFTTTATRVFIAASAATFFNPVTNFYELSAPVTAVPVGPTGNVAANTVTSIVSGVNSALQLTNTLPMSGGTDAEDNTSLLSRIRTKLVGNNVGTPDGILSIVDANTQVIESLLIRPGDPELSRDEFGNAADVVVIGEVLEEVNEDRVYVSGTLSYQLIRQPVNSVSSITGTAGGGAYTFILNTDYVVDMDYNSISRGTINAQSAIRFLGATLPDAGSTFTVIYAVNSLIETLQTELNNDANKIVGSDILAREAVKVLIRIGATITALPGYIKADVIAAAEDVLSTYLNALTLGADVQQSDIITVIQNTTGVDSVVVPLDTVEVKRPTDPGFSTVVDIDIARTEYGRPDTDPGAITIV